MDSNSLASRRTRGACIAFAVLAAAVACDTTIDPPLEIQGNGSLEGLVFFDASEDGLFDPSDGDFAIADVSIAIRNRGTEDTFAGGSAQSDASGRFAITSLPVGTHDMWIDTLSVPDSVSICQNPLRVTVFFDETQFADVAGRPGCLITIAEAKELPIGAFVVVKGIVTSFPGQIEPGMSFIQDATAGTTIFRGASLEGLGIEVGDQIEIGAFTGFFAGLFELVEPITLRSLVEDVGELQPDTVTTAEISGATSADPIQGRFIRVEGARLMAAFGSGSLDGQNAIIDDGSGPTEIRMEDNVAVEANLNTIFTVGACYNINGFGHSFNVGQMLTRSTEAGLTSGDVVEVPCN